MKSCQMEKQFTKVSRYTGKAYKKWEWIGWTKLPDFSQIEHTVKGDWVIIKGFDGSLERYDVKNIVEVN